MLWLLSACEAKPSRNAIGGARGTEAEYVSVIFCEKHFFIAGLWLAWWQAEGWYPNSVASQVFTVTDPDKSRVDSPQLSNCNFPWFALPLRLVFFIELTSSCFEEITSGQSLPFGRGATQWRAACASCENEWMETYLQTRKQNISKSFHNVNHWPNLLSICEGPFWYCNRPIAMRRGS